MHFTGNVLSSLILKSVLGGEHYDYPHFIAKKTELQRVRNLPRVTQLESNGADMQTQPFSNKAHALKQLMLLLSEDAGVWHSLMSRT